MLIKEHKMLTKKSLDQALMKSKSNLENNRFVEFKRLYQTSPIAFLKNKSAQQKLVSLYKIK